MKSTLKERLHIYLNFDQIPPSEMLHISLREKKNTLDVFKKSQIKISSNTSYNIVSKLMQTVCPSIPPF